MADDLAAEGGVDAIGQVGQQQLLEHPEHPHHHGGEAEHDADGQQQ